MRPGPSIRILLTGMILALLTGPDPGAAQGSRGYAPGGLDLLGLSAVTAFVAPAAPSRVPGGPPGPGGGVSSRVPLSQEQARQIGLLVWKNECNGTVEGLTSWNQGEEFPSLGIGHFIWYPSGYIGRFQESFPEFLKYAASRGLPPPAWLAGTPPPPCPWRSRAEFLADSQSPRMKELRQFLVDTFDLQTEFLVRRQEQSLPRILAGLPPAARSRVQAQYDRVAARPLGPYVLIDYVNFKGEGVLETERYDGEGWGLLQVLSGMDGDSPEAAIPDFIRSAKERLTIRVSHSPRERNEARWLEGWFARLDGYREE